MKDIRFVTRADDAGSSRSANFAIAKVVQAKVIRNVSVMAVGAHVEHAAELLSHNKDICIGMHATLNAEWDRVKWGPLSDLPSGSGLVDDNGYFLPDPALFRDTKPPVELILQEYDAQLDRLTRAGFTISYVDSHCLPEQFVDGLDQAMKEWIARKGLIDHMYYYNLPPGFLEITEHPERSLQVLRKISDGQYFYVAHPAFYSEETLLMGNRVTSGEEVAKARSNEARLFSRHSTRLLMRALGIRPLRYDEAQPQQRMDPIEFLNTYYEQYTNQA